MAISRQYENVHQLARKLTSSALAAPVVVNVDNMTLVSQLKRKQKSGRSADYQSPLLLGNAATQQRGNAVESVLREAEQEGLTPEVVKTVENLRRENQPGELWEQRETLETQAMDQTKSLKKRTYATMCVGILTLALAATTWPPVTSSATSMEFIGDSRMNTMNPLIIDDDDSTTVLGSTVPFMSRFPWVPSNDGKTIEATEAHGSSELEGILGDIYKGDRIHIAFHHTDLHLPPTERAYTVTHQPYWGDYPKGRLEHWKSPVLVEPKSEGYKGLQELHGYYFR